MCLCIACLGSFLLQDISLHEFAFEGQNMKFTMNMLLTCILYCAVLFAKKTKFLHNFKLKTRSQKPGKLGFLTTREPDRLRARKNRMCYRHARTRGNVMSFTRKFGDFRQVSAVLRFLL